MPCYEIPYVDRWGKHVASKWGQTPQEAAGYLRKSIDGSATVGEPILMEPQPFTEAYRANRQARAAA
jgi:hypothetical protein